MPNKEDKTCFVIMPFSDCEGYESGHFNHVYNDIIKPAVEMTEYVATRADEVKETNLIHVDMLKKLIDAPICICDLSTRNPNVLFELGIRQAFDKPVVLIQEKGTPKIFDITLLRYVEYSKEMKYHEVVDMQYRLRDAINATKAAEVDAGNINSIVKLMSLSSPALMPKLNNNNKEVLSFDVVRSEIVDMRRMFEIFMQETKRTYPKTTTLVGIEYERISNKLEKLESAKISLSLAEMEYSKLMHETEPLMMNCMNENEHMMIKYLRDRIFRQRENFFKRNS